MSQGLGGARGSALRLALAALATALACSVQAAPGETPPPSDPHDISGVWFGRGNLDADNGTYLPIDGGPVPFTPRGRAIYKHRQAAADAGNPIRSPSDECMPHGVPAVIRLPTPLQVIQTPGQTTILYEAGRTTRLIYMDEKQPAHPAPTFMGHSVGHWEGDVLVVDTIGMRPTWLDISGAPASGRMHVVERIRKLNGGKELEDLFSIDDPVMYSRRWSARRVYGWHPEERVEEYVCEETLRVEPGAAHGAFRRAGQ